tara:strand:- start:743 stop:1399 length:657 start_codon:yes stop_codon:yes gene_type:complete
MIKKNWTFLPYDEEVYNKSKHRVMFVGADPNDAKKTNELLSKKDMGVWFNELPEGCNQFYKRTVKMLRGILIDIPDGGSDRYGGHEKRLEHMRFIDLKATPGTAKAKTKEVRDYIQDSPENQIKVSKYFNDPHTFPKYVVLLGNHVHELFFEFRENKKLSFHKKSLAVCMPHPSHSVGYEALEMVSKNDLLKKFRPITDKKLCKWTFDRGKGWHEVSS